MSFKHAAVLAPVSFFLGVLFICLNVDHRLLWGELTDESVNDGFQFYTTFFSAPPAIKALLHGMVAVGLIGIISKLHQWNDSAKFFDGSSLVAYMFSVTVYLTVTVPALRTIATPLPQESREVRIEAIRVLSAGNIIMMIALMGVLVLQAGQEYAKRMEARMWAQTKEKEATEKKTQ